MCLHTSHERELCDGSLIQVERCDTLFLVLKETVIFSIQLLFILRILCFSRHLVLIIMTSNFVSANFLVLKWAKSFGNQMGINNSCRFIGERHNPNIVSGNLQRESAR